MKTYKNECENKLLKLIFKDKDIIHLRFGESLTVDSRSVLKEEYV